MALLSPPETLSSSTPWRSPTFLLKEMHVKGMLSSFRRCLLKCLENLDNYRMLPFKG